MKQLLCYSKFSNGTPHDSNSTPNNEPCKDQEYRDCSLKLEVSQ